MTVDADADMTTHSQRWGPAAKKRLIAHVQIYTSVTVLCTVPRPGVWCVIEDLVLFIYSVQPGCKFHWLLDLHAVHPTGTQSGLSSSRIPSQVLLA